MEARIIKPSSYGKAHGESPMESRHMSILDLIILAFFGLAILQGAARGVIAESLAVIGTIGAFVAASRAGGPIADKLVDTTGIDTAYADPLAFSLVFLLVLAGASILVAGAPNPLRRKRRKGDTDKEGWNKKLIALDMIFGALLAPIRPWVILASVSLVLFTYLQQPEKIFGHKSALQQSIIHAGHILGDMIPANYPFSRRGIITSAPRIDDTPASSLPGVKDQKKLDAILKRRLEK